MDEKDRELVVRMIDERIRDLASLGETNANMAAKIHEIELTEKYAAAAFIDFRKDMQESEKRIRKDMAEGFRGTNHRLDGINGHISNHEQRLDKQENRITTVETVVNVLRVLILPILVAVAVTLIVTQLTGGPPT